MTQKPRNRKRSLLRRWAQSLYLLLVQTFVGALALLLFVYFAANSPSAPGRLSQLLSSVLPGKVELVALRLDSSLGRLLVRGVRVLAPTGELVLAADEIDLHLQVWPVLDSLIRQRPELPLSFPHIGLKKPVIRIEFDKRGRLLLAQAFGDPDEPPSTKPGKALRLNIVELDAQDLDFLLEVPAIGLIANRANLHAAAQIQTHALGVPPTVRYQIAHLHIPELQTKVASMRDLPPIPAGTAWLRGLDGDLQSLSLRGLGMALPMGGRWYDLQLPDTVLQDARIDVRLAPELEVVASQVHLATSTQSTFMGPLLGSAFDCVATIDGGFRLDPRHGFSADGAVRARGKLSGFQSELVTAQLEVHTGALGQAAVQVDARDLQIHAYQGRLSTPILRYRLMSEDKSHHVAAQFHLNDFVAAGALRAEAVGMHGVVPDALQGRLSGDLGVAVRTELFPGQTPGLALDVAIDNNLTLEREGPLVPLSKEIPHLHLQGGVFYAMGPNRNNQIDLADLVAHTSEHVSDRTPGREWLQASGHVDLTNKTIDLHLGANLPRLERALEPLGVLDTGGALTLGMTHVHGSLLSPEIKGELHGSNLYYQQYRANSAKMKLGLRNGTLYLDDLVADSDIGSLSANIEFGLFDQDISHMRATRRLALHKLNAKRVDLTKLLALYHVGAISGQATMQDGDVEMNLGDLASLRVRGALVLDNLQAYGESFPHVETAIQMHGTHVNLANLQVKLETGDTIKGQFDYDVPRHHYVAELDVPMTELLNWHALRVLKQPINGALGGTVKVDGDNSALSIDANLQMRHMGYDKIDIGDAQLQIHKTRDGPAILTSCEFFPKFALETGSQIVFAKLLPLITTLRIKTLGPIDPYEVMGMEKPAGLGIKLQSEVELVIDQRPGQPIYRVEAHLPPAGLELDLGSGLRPVRNTSPADIGVLPDGVTISSVYLDVESKALELCGEFKFADFAKDIKANLLLYMSGTLDVPRVGALTQTFAGLDLKLDILSDPRVAGDVRAQCLTSARIGKGALRVEGALDALAVQGSVRTQAGHMTLRRFGHDIGISEGGHLRIASDGKGNMTISIPREHQFAGTLEDGRFAAWGQAKLIHGAVETVDFALTGEVVPYIWPKNMSVLISPDLKFKGTQLSDPVEREMTLEGKVELSEGNYYKSFDNVSSIVSNVRDREADSFSKPITETMPWLNEVQMNFRVSSNDFGVSSRIPLGKLDINSKFDLWVRGTLPGLRIHDHLEVVPGDSKMMYSLNRLVFEFERGTLDFDGDMLKPVMDITLKADIALKQNTTTTGVASASALGQDLVTDSAVLGDVVVVYVHVSGRYDPQSKDLNLELSSNKGDKPADVMCLILRNQRCNDTGGGAPTITTGALFNDALGGGIAEIIKDFVKLGPIDIDPTGSVTASATKQLGKRILLGVKVQTGTASTASKYASTFNFRISEALSASGLWRRTTTAGTAAASNDVPTDVYEFKIRYTKPLD